MTLGCGGYGGNITSDNISPRHLLNIKRLAYETAAGDRHARAARTRPAPRPRRRRCRRSPAAPPPAGVDAALVRQQMDALLGTRTAGPPSQTIRRATVVQFVCEEDVRQALKLGRKILIGERTIITPSARDLA